MSLASGWSILGISIATVLLPVETRYRIHKFVSTPARSRTWLSSLEARHDVRFTIGACSSSTPSGRQGSRTLISTGEQRISGAFRQPDIRLPSITICQWTRRELNPRFQHAALVSSRWTTSPFLVSNRDRSRARRTDRAKVSRLLGTCQSIAEVRPGLEPGLLPYRGSVPPRTPTDRRVTPAGIEPALSWLSPRRLCHWTRGSFQ